MVTIRKLVPILRVREFDAEVAFYQSFGFAIHYQGDDIPGFVALVQGSVLFGIELREDFSAAEANRALLWQFEVADLREIVRVCEVHSYRHIDPICTWEAGDDWAVAVWSPNGYKVQFEGPRLASGTAKPVKSPG